MTVARSSSGVSDVADRSDLPDDAVQRWSASPPPGHGTPSDRGWAVLSHLSLVLLALAVPLAVVLSRGRRSPYVCHQAVEALNFQITVVVALLLCSLAAVVPGGLVLLPVVVAAAVTYALQAAAAARRGAWHRYPVTFRFLS